MKQRTTSFPAGWRSMFLGGLLLGGLALALAACSPAAGPAPVVITVIATSTPTPLVVTAIATPPPLTLTEPTPLPPPPAGESFDAGRFWDEFPLPPDADLVPVVEGLDLAFTTGLAEPQVFDYYATWFQGQGWTRQAPVEAVETLPRQVWLKDVAEVAIEVPGLDEAGRTQVWVQLDYITTGILPPEVGATSTTDPGPTQPDAEPIGPANADRLVEVAQTHVGPNRQDLAWAPAPPPGWLAVVESSRLYLYEAGSLAPLALPHEIEANRMAFSPDGALLATTRYVGTSEVAVDLWRVADWTRQRTLEGHAHTIMDLAFDPGGSLLATASMDASVRLWRVEDGALLHDLKVTYEGVHPPAVLSVAFDPKGWQVVAGLYGGWVQGWRVENGMETMRFQASALAQPNQVLFLPGGELLTVNGASAKVWQVDDGQKLVVEFQSEPGVYSVALSPDGRLLASTSSQGVELLDADTLRVVHRLETGGLHEVAFSPDGRLLATLETGDDLLRLWAVGSEPSLAAPYAQVWQHLGSAGGRLGQPLGPAVEDSFAVQHFEGGLMHWGRGDREGEGTDSREVQVVAYGPGGDAQSGDLWGRFDDDWRQGDEEYPCPEAEPPLGPVRGFGLVWCKYVHASLGAPLEAAYAVEASYQDFEYGTMLWVPADGGVYVLFNEGDWQFEALNGE